MDGLKEKGNIHYLVTENIEDKFVTLRKRWNLFLYKTRSF